MTQIILSFLLFFFAVSASFYLPGIAVLHLADRQLPLGAKHILAWVVGYCVFIFLSYVGAYASMPFLPLIFIAVALIYCLFKRKEIFTFGKNKMPWGVVALIIFASLSFTSLSFLSGLVTDRGFQFIGSDNGTDAIMHLARIKTQVYAFPPIYTGFSGYAMHGYHYFYDFLLSRFVLFYHLSAEDLYYRLFPFFISVLYGSTLYLLSGIFTKKNIDKLLILFFAYFGASLGYALSFFTHTANAGSGMGLVQQIELVLDPSIIFSSAVLFAGLYILLREKTLINAMLVGIIIGLLAQMKIYAGIIGLGTLVLYSCYLLYKYKLWRYVFIANIVAIFLTALTYLPNNLGVGHLIFAPFFLYENLLKQPIFDQFNIEMRMFLYREHHKVIHLWMFYGLGFILFWILALGSRIAFLFGIAKIFKKKFWTEGNIILAITILVPLILATFFIQSILIFDTVQFLWMVAIFISIPAGIFYGQIYALLPKYGKYLLIILLILFSFGEFYYNEDIYIFHPHYTTEASEHLLVARIIGQTVPESSFFVVAPTYVINRLGEKSFQYYPAPLFSGLTGRRTYYEYEVPEFSDTKKVAQRKNQIEEITLAGEKCDGETISKIMKQIGTKYLLSQSDYPCEDGSHLRKITTQKHWTFWLVE